MSLETPSRIFDDFRVAAGFCCGGTKKTIKKLACRFGPERNRLYQPTRLRHQRPLLWNTYYGDWRPCPVHEVEEARATSSSLSQTTKINQSIIWVVHYYFTR